jgi:hypothetical protein
MLFVSLLSPQWEYKEDDNEALVMLDSDVALVNDYHNITNEGAVSCAFNSKGSSVYDSLEGDYCPISKTYDIVKDYCEDEMEWLRDFFTALDKMLKNGY